MHVGDLGPREWPVELIQPGERRLGSVYRETLPPTGLVSRLIEHVHRDVAEMAALVEVLRIQRQREVVNVLGIPPDPLATGRGALAIGGRRTCTVEVPLVVDRSGWISVGALPPRVPTHSHTSRSDDLILRNVEVHQERREFAVELACGVEWVLLPAIAVVDHHLRVPLREV